jgi:hypothetical protein
MNHYTHYPNPKKNTPNSHACNIHTDQPLSTNTLHAFPPPIIDLALQPSRNQTLNPTFKPNFPEQRIIPALVQEQLVMAA